MVKACDISNEVRPMEVSEPWVDCLLEEYYMQSDREKSEGLPVSQYMDRDLITKPKAQIGFLTFILLPMYKEIARVRAVTWCSIIPCRLKVSNNNNLLLSKIFTFFAPCSHGPTFYHMFFYPMLVVT